MLLIRRRTARSCAPTLAYTALLFVRRRGLPVPVETFRLDVASVHRLGWLLGHQQRAIGLLECGPEPLDGVFQRHDRVFAQVASLPDRGVDAGVRAAELVLELGLEPTDVFDGHIVQEALVTHPDGDDLALNRERAVLRLLQQLNQPRA